MPGGRPPGLPKTGGRKVGSKNKLQVTEDMRRDILTAYKRLGGVAWLVKWAQANETEFVGKVLSHVLPAPVRDEPAPTVTINQPLISADTLTDREAALRIAFALSSVAQRMEQGRTIEVEPVAPPPEPVKPTPAEPVVPPPTPAPAPESEPDTPVHFGSGAEQGRRRNLL